MDFFTIAVGFFLTLTFYMGLTSITKRVKKLPPGPTRWPIIGSLHLLGDKPHQSLANLAKKHGPIMSLKLGQVTTVVVSSAEIAKVIHKTQDHVFCSRKVPDASKARDFSKYSILWLPAGTEWKALRRVLTTNVFSVRRLDENQELRTQKVQELIDYCRQCSETGEAVSIGRVVVLTTLNLLSNTVFSKDVVDPFSDSTKEFRQLLSDITLEAIKPNLVDFFPFLARFDPQGIRRRTTGHFEKFINLISVLIDERLAANGSKGDSGGDFLDVLLAASTETPELIHRKHIEYTIMDMFLAGTDTTTVVLEWAMAEMLKNPDEMKKVQDELAQVIGKGNVINEANIAQLPYLRCVIKETLRLHAPGPFLIPRQAMEDAEVCGYNVPKGSQVFVNVWAVARDETIWKDALKFMPERFLDSKIDFLGQHYELIPFGSGRRICPGLQLGSRMLHVMLGSLLNCFNWKLEGGNTPESLNMDERFGITVPMANQLHAIPIPL